MQLPSKEQQIVQSHALLIVGVVHACYDRTLVPSLERSLHTFPQEWHALTVAIRQIIAGTRARDAFAGLDSEERIIVQAILCGLDDADTLPSIHHQPAPVYAAPGLASIIAAVNAGDANARQALDAMAEQMRNAGGELERLGRAMMRLVAGERDAQCLSQGMNCGATQLLTVTLEELGKRSAH